MNKNSITAKMAEAIETLNQRVTENFTRSSAENEILKKELMIQYKLNEYQFKVVAEHSKYSYLFSL